MSSVSVGGIASNVTFAQNHGFDNKGLPPTLDGYGSISNKMQLTGKPLILQT
jgi:hypothetical protein